MKSRSHLYRSFSVFAVGLLAAAPAALGQAFYLVSKAQVFTQTSSAGAVADPRAPFAFNVESATNTTLTLPAGSTIAVPFFSGDNEYRLEQVFATKAALDAAFPNGTYRLTGSGVASLSFNLTADSYPSGTPAVTGGTWNSGGLLVVDPTQTVTINLSTFTNYATSGVGGHMETNIQGLFDNVSLSNQVTSVALFGSPAVATPINTITIPARTLTSGRVYRGEVDWQTATTLDTATVPGGGVVTLWGKVLNFYIAALAPGTTPPPAPLIAGQPANQVASVGSRATFSVGFSVGGVANQFNNLSADWYFNGVRINPDGAKYTFGGPGFALTVNNLTAADAGTYSAVLVNAGGIVTSAAATLTLGPTPLPTFTLQPSTQPLTVAAGSTVVLGAAANNATAYQWQRDGANIPGATTATLVVGGPGGVAPAAPGNYRVNATNSVGGAFSTATALTVVSTNDPGRLINLSILTPLAAGESMTMGTVLGGGDATATKPLLARAAGPSLSQFSITDFLPAPSMTLNFTTPTPAVVVATNTGWGGSATLSEAFGAVGAFPFVNTTSRDSAIFRPGLAPGDYTVEVRDAGNGSGRVIAELYDSTPNATFSANTPRLINVSVLKQIPAGGTLTVGFVIGGSTGKTVLVRAVGPRLGLAPFNIAGAMSAPTMTLVNTSTGATIATNAAWGGDPAVLQTANRVGAFAVTDPASKDAMLLMTLPAGNYTAQVGPVAGTPGGTAIVEVYEVP